MTFGSLFSGIGGIDLGLQRAGMECKWQIEIDDFCGQVLERHWKGINRYKDIKTIDGRELEAVDLLAGGFPCTDLSQAGKRQGLFHADGTPTRSGLWFEFARLIGELRPRFVLIENVPGLLVPGAMPRVVGELARLGYVGLWRCLRASDFGASHLRKRVFIVAYCCGEGRRQDARNAFGDEAADGRTRRKFCESNGDNFFGGEGSGLAQSPLRGRGELREPSGSDRFADGRDEELGDTERSRRPPSGIGCDEYAGSEPETRCGNLADSSIRFVSEPWRRSQRRDGVGSAGEILPDANSGRCEVEQSTGVLDGERSPFWNDLNGCGMPFAPGPSDPRWPDILRERPDLAPALANTQRHSNRGESEARRESQRRAPSDGSGSGISRQSEEPPKSQVRGMADGLPDFLERAMSDRMKRLSRLGNAVVPDCAQWIGERIMATAE